MVRVYVGRFRAIVKQISAANLFALIAQYECGCVFKKLLPVS